ncbi:3beta-hydroxy-delta5-steroid dehydrogenase/steroid delta-isomerase [Sinobacterium caligoides]|uniref:3beta-hydroxy-delta5-steroid dehydrogenase/steroid delta-isomerase n=1 Tax=Sinobacterium caligoides TaxID=933926 RepID=A0A3N2DQ15_9GAMM|nr:NAD-dependent epimerase/dehydratase family protein [Sinobacterium caligoides]ROS01924.1 3beta-hydroxy-delta5-steroid dehydrogenase/steroid delta-isomerase [Sinobacterium caligoides]
MNKQKTVADAAALGRVLVTGGAGFVGQNLARTLLDSGCKVRVFDLALCPLEHENLEKIQGNICDEALVAEACKDIDTVFHTAAIIEIRSSKAVPESVRKLSYDINLGGTKNIVAGCLQQGVQRLIYTSSNSVVINGQPISHGDETMAYVEDYRDLYTETKTKAERFVLANNGKNGLYTCAIRPSGIWGPGDQTMFKLLIEQLIKGVLKVRPGDGSAKLDNSYVHNLIHGKLLAALQLKDGGSSPGEAYFINDNEPVNMMDFSRPVIEALGHPFPKRTIPFKFLVAILTVWQKGHEWFKLPEPPQPPLAVERICIDNYFSIEKARDQLGYEPLYNTEEAMKECLPYYHQLHQQMLAALRK